MQVSATEQAVAIEDARRRTTINARWVGSGRWGERPWVIMITGDGPKGSRSSGWTNVVPKLLQAGFDCFLFDFEGLGDSPGDRGVLTADVAKSNLHAVGQYLQPYLRQGVARGVYAASFGAYVALQAQGFLESFQALALKSPAVWLADAYLNELTIDAAMLWLSSGGRSRSGYEVEVLKAGDPIALIDTSAIGIPTLIVHGERDEIVPIRHALRLAASIPRASLHIVRGATHSYAEPGAWDEMAVTTVAWLAASIGGNNGAS